MGPLKNRGGRYQSSNGEEVCPHHSPAAPLSSKACRASLAVHEHGELWAS